LLAQVGGGDVRRTGLLYRHHIDAKELEGSIRLNAAEILHHEASSPVVGVTIFLKFG
jgi:hypothetical protein